MHFEHVLLCFLARETEDALKDHGDVGHEIDRVVMHHYLPWKIEFFFLFGLLFDHRSLHEKRLT